MFRTFCVNFEMKRKQWISAVRWDGHEKVQIRSRLCTAILKSRGVASDFCQLPWTLEASLCFDRLGDTTSKWKETTAVSWEKIRTWENTDARSGLHVSQYWSHTVSQSIFSSVREFLRHLYVSIISLNFEMKRNNDYHVWDGTGGHEKVQAYTSRNIEVTRCRYSIYSCQLQ